MADNPTIKIPITAALLELLTPDARIALVAYCNGLEYRVIYWWNGTRHSVWMADWELEAA